MVVAIPHAGVMALQGTLGLRGSEILWPLACVGWMWLAVRNPHFWAWLWMHALDACMHACKHNVRVWLAGSLSGCETVGGVWGFS